VNLAEKMNDGAKYNGYSGMSQTCYAGLIAVFFRAVIQTQLQPLFLARYGRGTGLSDIQVEASPAGLFSLVMFGKHLGLAFFVEHQYLVVVFAVAHFHAR